MVIEMCLVGFLFSFSIKIFFSNEQKIENNKISFSVFSIETRNLILGKIKTRWQGM